MFIMEVWNKKLHQKSLSFYSVDDPKSELGFGVIQVLYTRICMTKKAAVKNEQRQEGSNSGTAMDG